MPVIKLFLPLFFLVFSVSCTSNKINKNKISPLHISAIQECALDGMIIANFPGPKAQIHYHDGKVEFFCETEELTSVLHQPGIKALIVNVLVQNTSEIDWQHPSGGWYDASQMIYVVGSKKQGAMGATLAPFKDRSLAEAFIKIWGGRIVTYREL